MEPEIMPDADPLQRIHERLDDVFQSLSTVASDVAIIKSQSPVCQQQIKKHEEAIYGNGKEGLVTRIAAAETGRVDTLSVKAVCIVLGAVGTLAGAIGAAIGAAIK